MRRHIVIYIAILFGIVLLRCGGQIKSRIALKHLIEDNENSSNPNDMVIKLRWSFDPATFDSAKIKFPQCGVTLYRKKPNEKTFSKIGNFKLPSSKTDLTKKITKIRDNNLKNRLINSATGNLTEEGENLFTAVEASKNGKEDEYTLDPTQLLMMASLHPDMAQILGLFYADTVSIKQNDSITYKLVGSWDWGKGCTSDTQDSIIEEIKVALDPPLDSPAWLDRIDSLKQLRQIEFDKPGQQITYFWDDSKGEQQKPPPLTPEEPVVESRWWKTTDDYVGYHIDRWTDDEEGIRCPPIRVNTIPKLLFNVGLKYCNELDNKYLSSELRELLNNKGISLAQKVTVWIGEKGKKWFMTDKENDPTQRYFFAKEENKLNIYKLNPYLILSSVDAEEEVPERFLDTFVLRPEKTYAYRIIAVDIFGRQSGYSEDRTVKISPIDFTPIPPQRVCLESFDPVSGTLLSESCPKKIGNTYTWISPGDLKQKDGTEEIWIRLKWQWTEEQQEKYNAKSFNIYQDTVSCTGDGKDNDSDGKIDEEFPNGIDDDADLLVDEDLAVTGKLLESNIKIYQGQKNYEKSFLLQTKDPITNKKRPVRYFYYSITAVSKNIDDDNDGKRDEDPVDGIDNDGDNKTDEDDIVSESWPSIPVMAYAVDKKSPKMPKATCEENTWLKVNKDPTQTPDWEGKLALYLAWSDFAKYLPDDDIDGYNLYRSIDKSEPPEANYVRLNRELIESTVFVDHIEATAQNKFYYKIEAVDKAGNISKKSDASCPIKLADKISPTPAIIISVRGGNKQIILECEPSSSPDTVGYYVYRGTSRTDVDTRIKNKSNRLNTAPITVGLNSKFFNYTDIDPNIEAGKNYYYIVEAVDTSGNQAFSLPAAGRAYDMKPPAPPSNLAAKVKIIKPNKATKENSLIKVTRITPPKVRVGEAFFVKILIKVKTNQVEFVSFSDDPRGQLVPTEDLYSEWYNPMKDSILTFEYKLRVPNNASPGKYEIWGYAKAVKMGNTQLIKKMISEIEVVSTGISKTMVVLSWKLPETDSRAAIYRCKGDACTTTGGYWKMIAPLQPANKDYYEDSLVQIGNTYYYKVNAYDKVGNKGKFSKVLKVKIE